MTPANTRRIDQGSRTIHANPAAIYRALLDPQAVTTWRAPDGMKGQMQHFDPVVGGTYKMSLIYEDTTHQQQGKTSENEDAFEGRFIELIPDEKVVEEVVFESEDPAFAGTMRITTSLQPAANGTLVTITCENVPRGIREEDHAAGIASSLKNLAAYTENQ